MPLYMTQFAYTSEAWAALAKNPEDRSEVVRKLMESMGGRMISFHYSFGEYDGVIISEAPDEKAVATGVLAAASAGHLKSVKTTTLLSVDDTLEVMQKVGEITYQGPES